MDWRPNNNYSIERVNNNLGYYPDNCVWATKLEQQNNRRKPRNNTSGYIGVSKIRNGAYSARLRYNNEEYHLLQTKNIEEAALAYDVAAIFFKGSQATTNILKL